MPKIAEPILKVHNDGEGTKWQNHIFGHFGTFWSFLFVKLTQLGPKTYFDRGVSWDAIYENKTIYFGKHFFIG